MTRSVNAATTLLLTMCALALLGWYTDLLVPVAVASVTAFAFLVTGLVGAREELPTIALASVGYVIAAVLSVATLAITLAVAVTPIDAWTSLAAIVSVSWQSLLFALAAALGAFGAFSAPRQADVPTASTAISLSGIFVSGVLSVAVVAAFSLWALEAFTPVEALLTELEHVREAVFEPEATVPPLGSFLVLVAIAGFAVASVLRTLPIAVFASRKRRESVRESLGWLRARILLASVLALVSGPLFLAAPEDVWLAVRDHDDVPPDAYDLLLSVTASELLRALLYRVVIVSVVLLCAVWVLRRLRLEYVNGPARYLARGFGGIVVLAAVLVVGPGVIVDRATSVLPEGAHPILTELVAEFGPLVPVVVALGLVFAAVLALIGLVGLLGLFRIVPPRTASPVLAAVGIGAASFAAGLLEGPSPILFVTVPLAVVVWDVGSYDRRLRAEIGDGATTRRAELTHTGASLAVAVGAGVIVYLSTTVVSMPSGEFATAGLASLLGTVLLLSVLRG